MADENPPSERPIYRTIGERRKANQKEWRENPNTAFNRYKNKNIAEEGARLPTITVSKRSSIARLSEIMLDPELPLHKRLDAAEIILGYELGPGAVAGVDPDDIAAESYRFLKAVTEATDIPDSLAFRALRAVAQVENVRAAVKNAGESLGNKRAMFVDLVNAHRRRWLIQHNLWPADREHWWLANDDAFDWPDGWPGFWPWPTATIAARYPHATKKQLEKFHSILAASRATNRPDNWPTEPSR